MKPGYQSLRAEDLAEALRSGDELGKLDFRGANFANLDLHGIYATCIDFAGANFSGADLSESVLYCSGFSAANLAYADLSDTNCYRADFRGANLRGCDFSCAGLDNAQIRGCDVRGTNFTGASLADCDLIASAWWRGAKIDGVYIGTCVTLGHGTRLCSLTKDEWKLVRLARERVQNEAAE